MARKEGSREDWREGPSLDAELYPTTTTGYEQTPDRTAYGAHSGAYACTVRNVAYRVLVLEARTAVVLHGWHTHFGNASDPYRKEQGLHFLDLPFYRTGEVTKRPVGDEDVEIIARLLRKQNPGQIYVAGDLSDPHGTHRVCAEAIFQALEQVRPEGVDPVVWLYRGAWQEFEPHEIEMAVPLSPEVALQKKMAIFKHESQKDRALFPGNDEREFWVRAEERTKKTARIYNELGLPEFFALEGFVRFTGGL